MPRLTWPFALRSSVDLREARLQANEDTILSLRARHDANLVRAREEYEAAVNALRSEYGGAIEAARAAFQDQAARLVLAERSRCARVVMEIPVSSRASFVRERALDGILNPPAPTGTRTTTLTPTSTTDDVAAPATGGA